MLRRLCAATVLAIALAPGAAAQVSPDDWIVLLREGEARPADAALELAAAHGATIRHVYRATVPGFAARIPAARLEMLARDPRVAGVYPDREIGIAGHRPNHRPPPTSTPTTSPSTQLLPTGVDRVEADAQTVTAIDNEDDAPDIDIAVIDTGVQLDHPDLRVAGDVSFIAGAASGADDHGHGTMVAGIAAARDDAAGVVGVCPGARVWAVKVLDSTGNGALSDLAAGVDWAADASKHPPIEVVNISITAPVGPNEPDPLLPMVRAAVAKGIVVIAAAGNAAADALDEVPARYEEAICVSALADSDGQPGGLGLPTTSSGADDTFADFSNYGSVVDMIAPGADITSTYTGGLYAIGSGTSFAAPHVAGGAALYLLAHPASTPAAVRAGLAALATEPGTAQWSGDPDGTAEPLLNVGALAPAVPGVYVSVFTDKASYVAGLDAAAIAFATPKTETGTAIAGLQPTDFIVDLDGAAAPVTMTASGAAGTYEGRIDLALVGTGSHTVTVAATDGRGFVGSGSAALFVSSGAPGGGSGGSTTASGGASGDGDGGGGGGGGGGCALVPGSSPAGAAAWVAAVAAIAVLRRRVRARVRVRAGAKMATAALAALAVAMALGAALPAPPRAIASASPMPAVGDLNEIVLKIAHSYPRNGTHRYWWPRGSSWAGTTRDLFYLGEKIADGDPEGRAYCCGLTFEVFVRSWEAWCLKRKLEFRIGDLAAKDVLALRADWYCAGGERRGPVAALVPRGIGVEVGKVEDARPGDLVQLWRANGTGHSVVFLGREGGGIRYWSTQKSTNGVGYQVEKAETLHIARAGRATGE